MKKISIFWEGMPICGMLVEEVYKKYTTQIFATKSKSQFDTNIFKIYKINISELKYKFLLITKFFNIIKSDIFLITGWGIISILITCLLKINLNLKVICVVDNIYHNSRKQNLAIFFKIGKILDLIYKGYFVPGRLSYIFLKKLGVSKPIYLKSYGASKKIFYQKKNILHKKNEFIFVGLISKRKASSTLIKAYKAYKDQGGTWELRLVGDIEKGVEIFDFKSIGIIHQKFLQPNELNETLNKSKCFILPSKLDHWGTVLCEAAATGMVLLGSSKAGSSYDLIDNGSNGFIFDPNLENISKLMHKIEKLDNTWLEKAEKISIMKSFNFTEYSYKNSLEKMLIKI
jgi:glycosyltransferase involved in cell wall biosynthesis